MTKRASHGFQKLKTHFEPLSVFGALLISRNSGQLCHKCEALDLRKALLKAQKSKGADHTIWREQLLGKTSELNQRKDRCSLCRLIYFAIECSTPMLDHLDSES
jgi:hypothetical protein